MGGRLTWPLFSVFGVGQAPSSVFPDQRWGCFLVEPASLIPYLKAIRHPVAMPF